VAALPVIWHGTQQESFDLVNAISHNCQCVFEASGVRITTCPPHEMLTHSQRCLDGLLFMRRFRARLEAQEFQESERRPAES
jgi:hypothetical protein